MGAPMVTKFLWCISLEAGTRIFGFVITLLPAASLSYQLYELWRDSQRILRYFLLDYNLGFTATIVHLLLGVLLLVAAFMRSRRGVSAWLPLAAAGNAAVLAALAVMVPHQRYYAEYGQPFSTPLHYYLLTELFLIGITAYGVVYVHSYYLMLKNDEDDKRTLTEVQSLYPSLSLHTPQYPKTQHPK